MPVKLRREHIVTIKVLADKGQNHCQIARQLGVTESTVRYHLKRAAEKAQDGRRDKPFKAAAFSEVIDAWHSDPSEGARPVNLQELYEHLVYENDFNGSYKALVRYVRRHYPAPQRRTYRRVETPPGAQTQTDWGEYSAVDLGDGPEPLSCFVMVLSHSRRPAAVWSRRKDLLSWLHCHNEAFRRLAGIAAVNRIDNVKTAISKGAGAWGERHPAYRAYAQAVGFHIDACEARAAEAKGKVEAKVRLGRLRLDPTGRPFDGLEDLQQWTDGRIDRWCETALCPATGRTIRATWQSELERLAPLPLLPEPFDLAVTRPVSKDCLVCFEARRYTVPFRFVGQRLEVRGCAGKVQILAHGEVVAEYPRGTEERLLIDPSCYEGEATDRVLPPKPLGRMGRKLQEIYDTPVEQRPVDLYAALAEVAR
ncbi:MAG: IS21 family transposase [Acidobacteriota bacterium]